MIYVFLPALCLFIYAISGDSIPPFIITISIIYVSIRLSFLCNTVYSKPSLLLFHLFTLTGTLIPIFVQASNDIYRYEFVSKQEFDFTTPFLQLLIAIIMVDISYFFSSRSTEKSEKPALIGNKLKESEAPGKVFLLSLSVVGYFYILIAERYPGLDFFKENRLDQYLDYTLPPIVFAFATFFIRFYFIVPATLSFIGLTHKDSTGFFSKTYYFVVFILLLIPLSFFSNPLSTPRMVFFGIFLFFLNLISAFDRKLNRWGFVFSFLIGFYFVFPILGSASRTDNVVFNFGFKQISEYMSHPDLDNAIMYIVGYDAVNSTGFFWGKNVLSAILAFVPRTLWEGKSLGLGSEIIERYGDYFSNISSPYFLEWYADFGFFGVMLGAAVLGFAMARLQRSAASSYGISMPVLANAALFASLPILLRGSLITGTVMLFCYFGVFFHVVVLRRLFSFGKRRSMLRVAKGETPN